MFVSIESLETRRLLASTWALANGTLTITGTTGNDNIYVSTSAGNTIRVADQNVQVGNLIPKASVQKILVNCKEGNDYAYVSLFEKIPTQIDGGAGNDGLTAATAGNNTVLGGAGKDNLVGGTANDKIDGGADDDILAGSNGNDSLIGGTGVDILTGGAGNDTIDGGLGADRLRGSEGTDTVTYASRTNPIIADLTNASTETADDGEAGEKDNIDADVEILIGGSGNDKLTGATFSGTPVGNTKNNTLIGNGGNDSLFGLDGNDKLDGGAGNDSLDGAAGNDTLIAGLGTDKLIGGLNTDLADYSARTENLKLDLDGIADDGAAGENDSLAADIENLTGGKGADWIVGNGLNNFIRGGAGNDTLEGSSGNDTLYGDAGVDKIFGQSGNDVIYARKPAGSMLADNDIVDGGIDSDKAQVDPTDTKTSIETLLA